MRTKYLIIICMFFLWAGCRPEQKKAGPDVAGLKLQDLEPSKGVEFPSEIDIQVSTFTVPADQRSILEEISDICLRTPLKYIDKSQFDNNQLWSAFAMKEQWPQVASLLQNAGAIRVSSDSLIIFDRAGYEFSRVYTPQGSTLEHEDTEGHVKMTLEEGYLAWSVKARPLRTMQGTAGVRLELVYKKSMDITEARLKRQQEVEEQVFNFTSMAAKMSTGDIVLLSTKIDKPAAGSVNEVMFFDYRKIHKDNSVQEIDVVKVFVIVCTKVKNDIL